MKARMASGIVLFTATLLIVAPTSAGTWLPLATGDPPDAALPTPQPARVTVHGHDATGLQLTLDTPGLALSQVDTNGGTFLAVTSPDAPLDGAIGQPALPTIRRLFVVPPEASVEMAFDEGSAEIISLPAAGYSQPVVPMQPLIVMAPGAREQALFRFDQTAYAVDGTWPAAERVTVTELGMVRHQRLFMLEVRPVVYNPARAMLTVWPRIDVSISFLGGSSVQADPEIMPALNGALLNPRPAEPAGRSEGNYLIVVPDEYAADITTFASAKAAMGFNVLTHTVSPGTTGAQIKNYILSLWGSVDEPDYLLLVGDSDTIPAWTGQGDRHATTDLPYVCMDGGDDWYPDIALGRFSVRSTAELQAVVDKSLFLEAGEFPDPDFVKRAAFLATEDAASGAEETHDWVVSTYMDPNDFVSNKIYANQGGTAEDVADALNTGCLYTVYFGHSSVSGWWNPRCNQDDIRVLTNVGKYGLAFGFSCNTCNFANYDECAGETWIRESEKGAAAYLSASTLIYYMDPPWHEATYLEKHFFESFFAENIWEVSPAWQAALYDLLSFYGPENPVTRDYFEMFVLLGDPALHLPGTGFTLSADPATESLCCPPENQAQYIIDVQPHSDFAEAVTLAASGAPGGSTVQFSANSLPPPFSSVMTISNIPAGASPGAYAVEVTGTAVGGLERSLQVGLSLSTDPPGSVSLTSPTDGAIDVPRNPTLTWQAASQASTYELELATDVDFTNIVYSATETATTHQVGLNLETDTVHYWHVRALNGCGESGFSPTFSFNTIYQPDYFTEEFLIGKGFDLDNFSVTLTPDGSVDFYDMCGDAITELPTDPTGGTVVPVSDDSYEYVFPTLPVTLYGTEYYWFYVNSNGNITFLDGDGSPDESLTRHFSTPRISGVFDDLNPSAGGSVSYVETAELIAVTWLDVPEYQTTNTNTFQIEQFFDGRIRISWLQVDSEDSIVGLSEGIGIPADFLETDTSETNSCFAPETAVCCHGYICYDVDPNDPQAEHNEAQCLAEGGTYTLDATCAGEPCDCGGVDIRADSNCLGDGINSYDIDHFIQAVGLPEDWKNEHSCNFFCANDINCDGAVNSYDIDWFIDAVSHGYADPCP